MTHKEIVASIEKYAPTAYQESYDNTGWQVGNVHDECSGVLIALDITMEVLEEAIASGFNLVISHHPLIFSGIKSITGRNSIEQIIIKAIQNNVGLYAAHTNLDNVKNGVNAKIADRLLLKNTQVLQPTTNNLLKLVTYVPEPHFDQVQDALFEAGAGMIGDYIECSYSVVGEGTFRPLQNTHPTIGTAGGNRESAKEKMLSVLVNRHESAIILQQLRSAHPYEEVAYELYPLANQNQYIGAGVTGYLSQSMRLTDFMDYLKEKMEVSVIRHTKDIGGKVEKVGICGGSGSFLLKKAIQQQCDVFITGDFKYHQFFEAEDKIVILDIGHYESEQYTSEIFYDIIKNNFTNFAVRVASANTNPINYY